MSYMKLLKHNLSCERKVWVKKKLVKDIRMENHISRSYPPI